MIENLLKIICELGIFIVCAQTICCFRPKATYEKYLKFLVGIMILLNLLIPIGTFFGKDNSINLEEKLEAFYTEIEEGRKEALELGEVIDGEKIETTFVENIEEGKEKIQKISIERIGIDEASDG